MPALRGLDGDRLARLRRLATLFIHDKDWLGAHGFALDDWMLTRIAAEACLPILELGLDSYRHWRTLVVYESNFLAEHEVVDDDTQVVHVSRSEMQGESWQRGPIVLSWQAIEHPEADDVNVVIHEMAHSLDRGRGAPPLPRGLSAAEWRETLTDAFERLQHALDAGEPAWLDPYAAEAPEEFFAVASECFFMQPARLAAAEPALYALLAGVYRQDPVRRRR